MNLNPLFGLAGTASPALMPRHTPGNPQIGDLAKIFAGLGEALQGLADLLGGGKSSPALMNPFAGSPHFADSSASPATGSDPKAIAGKARIWGDPHFIGADGDQFDVQGKAGKIYNLLSDQNFQLNGKFEAYGSDGATVVGKAAINADGNFITVDKAGETFVNGVKLENGKKVELMGGGSVEKKGHHVIVTKGEWTVDFEANGSYLNMDIETKNAIADGVRPQGLIGQTFDGDGKALIGDAGAGAQGGGAIRDIHGNVTKAGDKDAVQSYEVDSLFSSIFKHHNSSGFAEYAHLFTAGDKASTPAQLDAEFIGQMRNVAMMGFFTLMGSLTAAAPKAWGSTL